MRFPCARDVGRVQTEFGVLLNLMVGSTSKLMLNHDIIREKFKDWKKRYENLFFIYIESYEQKEKLEPTVIADFT